MSMKIYKPSEVDVKYVKFSQLKKNRNGQGSTSYISYEPPEGNSNKYNVLWCFFGLRFVFTCARACDRCLT